MKSNGRAFWAILLALALLVNITVVSLAEEENASGGNDGTEEGSQSQESDDGGTVSGGGGGDAGTGDPDDPDYPDDPDPDAPDGSGVPDDDGVEGGDDPDPGTGTNNEDKVAPMGVGDPNDVVSSSGDISIEKTADVEGNVNVGDTITYTITVTNNASKGRRGAANPFTGTVRDPMGPGLWSIGKPIFLLQDSGGVWQDSYTYTVTEADAAEGLIINEASVAGITALPIFRGTPQNASVTHRLAVNQPQYQLTLEANPSEGGQVSGGEGLHYAGEKIDIEARPNSDYVFVNWTATAGDFDDDDDAASTTFTMPAADATVTANFASEEPEEEEPGMLSITKTAEEGFAEVGNIITYTITFENNSRQHLFFGKVVDEDLGRCWSFLSLGGPLAPGEERTIDEIEYTLDEGDLDDNGDFTNTATVSGYYKQWHTIGCIKFWKWAKAEASDSHLVSTWEEVDNDDEDEESDGEEEGDEETDGGQEGDIGPATSGGDDDPIIDDDPIDDPVVEGFEEEEEEGIEDPDDPEQFFELGFQVSNMAGAPLEGANVGITRGSAPASAFFDVGNPASLATVLTADSHYAAGFNATTDAFGRAVFPQAPGGDYDYVVTLEGYMPATGYFTLDADTDVQIVIMAAIADDTPEDVDEPVVEEYVEDEPEEEEDAAEGPVVLDYLESEPRADLPFTGGTLLNLALLGAALAAGGYGLRRSRARRR